MPRYRKLPPCAQPAASAWLAAPAIGVSVLNSGVSGVGLLCDRGLYALRALAMQATRQQAHG